MSAERLSELRSFLDAAFAGQFTDEDWEHTIGGTHVLLAAGGSITAHASVIERTLHAAGLSLNAGYVESVATRPDLQGTGLGSQVMRTASALIRESYELGALSTGEWAFYERLGWERWQGLTYVRNDKRLVRTPDDDDSVMVLRFGPSAKLDLRSPISCDYRTGDVW